MALSLLEEQRTQIDIRLCGLEILSALDRLLGVNIYYNLRQNFSIERNYNFHPFSKSMTPKGIQDRPGLEFLLAPPFTFKIVPIQKINCLVTLVKVHGSTHCFSLFVE